jgi:peptide/nickel transport system permease protein
MAILLVTHDWGVVADLCDRALVMYAGQVVEYASVSRMFHQPYHPYTKGLRLSDPHNVLVGHEPSPACSGEVQAPLPTIPGTVPPPGDWPAGCHFHPRCPFATAECAAAPIPLVVVEPAHLSRCIHYQKLSPGSGG